MNSKQMLQLWPGEQPADTEMRGGAGRAEGAGSGLGEVTEMLSQQDSGLEVLNSVMMETAAVLSDR